MVDDLTPRQYEVARLVATGLTNQEVACRLGISAQTVKNHMTAIYGNLGLVGKRLHLVIWALKEGMVTIEELELVYSKWQEEPWNNE